MNSRKEIISCYEFRQRIIDGLKDALGENVQVITKPVRKNNGVVLEGIIVKSSNSNVSPAFYVEKLYEEYSRGKTIEKIVDNLMVHYEKDNNSIQKDVSKYMDFSYVKENLIFRIVNYQDNEEILKDMPHRRCFDFAIVYYCRIKNIMFGNGSIAVINEHMEMWNTTEAQLYSIAASNTPKLFPEVATKMQDMLCSLMIEKGYYEEIDELDTLVDLYVLSNRDNYFGAVTFLYPDFIENFSKKHKKDIYIIPSSVHEVLLLLTDGFDDNSAKEIKSMIYEANSSYVMKEEILSYNLYFYDKHRKTISIVE